MRATQQTRPRFLIPTGWWIVIGSAVCMMTSGGLSFWSLGVYVKPLEDEFGWSRAQVSGATSISFLVGGLLGTLSGWVVDRSGVRPPLLFGAAGLGISLFLLAGVQNLWQFYALYACVALSRVWVNYIPFLRLMTRWFPERMGAPLGVMGLGASAAGLIYVPLSTLLVTTVGWRSGYTVSAAILLAVTVPIILMLRAPAGGTGGSRDPAERPHISLRQALRMRSFWLLAVALGLFFGGFMSFSFHSVPVFLSRGMSQAEAAGVVSAIALTATIARLTAGPMVDRITRFRLVAPLSGLAPALGLTVLALGQGLPALALFVLLWAVGTAVGPIMESVLLARMFGTGSFGAILGALGLAEMVGTVIGPYAGGALFDATGSYTWALLLYAGGFLISATAFALGDYRRPPERS